MIQTQPLIEEDLYTIALTQIPGIGDVIAKRLIAHCGSACQVFKDKANLLMRVEGVGETTARSIKQSEVLHRAEKEIAFSQKNNVSILRYTHKDYPKRLNACNDAPVLVYYRGNADLNNTKVLSIVGTRKATDFGRGFCETLVKHFEGKNVLIVSGLAYGIDVTAHRSALQFGLPTVGVLAHGLDMMYPSGHKSTSEKMVNNGGLLTDFMSGTNPDKENFPKRNRIVAGMADATIVVEAADFGGALITANIAITYNRDVFAVPGRPGDTYSVGCNKLITQNKAALITSGADIEYLMGWEETVRKGVQKQMFVELTADEEQIIKLLTSTTQLAIDDLAIQTNMPVSKIALALLNMELNGLIKCLPGKRYQIV